VGYDRHPDHRLAGRLPANYIRMGLHGLSTHSYNPDIL
jgi:hypothetical protein